MKTGTKSLLFGVHQFLLHPFFIFLAWMVIYRKLPCLKEWCAIVTHDWGYWGSPSMEGDYGEKHPERMYHWWSEHFGMFGVGVGELILGHSGFYLEKYNIERTKLFVPDKLCVTLYPIWLYLLLANLSGEIYEYMRLAKSKDSKYREVMPQNITQLQWLLEVRSYMALIGLRKEAECR